jgi:dihydroorotate dehydrogenase (NAD+) catalytic subunit
MVRRLETVEGVMGIELGLASQSGLKEVSAFTRAARGELPLIVRLPMGCAAELAQYAMETGASAVSLAPPRGIYPASDGSLVEGRLYGPAIFPMALREVKELARMGIPVIGAGGIYTEEHKDAMLKAGALAVQMDSILWREAGQIPFA